MHATQDERRAEPAVRRRPQVERDFGRRQRLEVARQAFQLRIPGEAKSIAKAALRAYAQNRVTVLERKIGDV